MKNRSWRRIHVLSLSGRHLVCVASEATLTPPWRALGEEVKEGKFSFLLDLAQRAAAAYAAVDYTDPT